MPPFRPARRMLLALLLALPLGFATLPALHQARAADDVTVFAAASLKGALDEVDAAWKEKGGGTATVSYAASSALAKQIEAGAPADVFLSADLAWMDYLAERKLIRDATRSDLLGNRLVLIAPKDKATSVTIEKGFDLAALLGDGRLAMGAVDSVPAGKYGKAALTALGIWPAVQGKVAGAENVRAALLLVSRGEAPFGIVYETDAKADAGVAIIGTFPQDSHPKIVYPAAALAAGKEAPSAAYLAFLKTPEAAAIFERYGFTMLGK
ncbi:molybdate transport system substrate-binding protein [Rhizobium sp. RU20A]|uniref:molybdate ABC transporter substrate-binding protein n=1 Tax=Rhizobium sp. RU20A TaxID=1907412 RepID=UPI0009568139|nr:molybdate ABC transporter substrate-binding protein [Rhizobium sp. RU20A]SIQ98742.1 molybdate transport system substrate-binding protein [Rhizobium sp. RU20A]